MDKKGELIAWLRQGRQKRAVALSIYRFGSVKEIWQRAQTYAPKISMRDTTRILKCMDRYGIVDLLNPDVQSGRVYAASSSGKTLLEQTFYIKVQPPPNDINWHQYAFLIRAVSRLAVFREIGRNPIREEPSKTATSIRKQVNLAQPISLNATLRSLEDLLIAGLIHITDYNKYGHKVYGLTKEGEHLYCVLQDEPTV